MQLEQVTGSAHTPSSAEFKKELSYTSTHPMGPPGPVTGFPLPLTLHIVHINLNIVWDPIVLTPVLKFC
jgi:hypothetical protein